MLPLYGYASEVERLYKRTYLKIYNQDGYDISLVKVFVNGVTPYIDYKVIQTPKRNLRCLKQFKTCEEGLDAVLEMNPFSKDVWLTKIGGRYALYIKKAKIINTYTKPFWTPVINESFLEFVEHWKGTISSAFEHYKNVNNDGQGLLDTI